MSPMGLCSSPCAEESRSHREIISRGSDLENVLNCLESPLILLLKYKLLFSVRRWSDASAVAAVMTALIESECKTSESLSEPWRCSDHCHVTWKSPETCSAPFSASAPSFPSLSFRVIYSPQEFHSLTRTQPASVSLTNLIYCQSLSAVSHFVSERQTLIVLLGFYSTASAHSAGGSLCPAHRMKFEALTPYGL